MHSAKSLASIQQPCLGGPGQSEGRRGTEQGGLGTAVTLLLTELLPEGYKPV